jgi:hypothetical protein
VYTVVFFMAAIAGATIQLAASRQPRSGERILGVFLLWLFALPLGLQSLYAAVGHLFMPAQVAQSIGWPTSPFQYEIAMANLALGVLGLACLWLRRNFWLAAALGNAVWLVGDGIGHISQLMAGDTAGNNAGPVLYTDIIVPLLALTLVLAYRSIHRETAALK